MSAHPDYPPFDAGPDTILPFIFGCDFASIVAAVQASTLPAYDDHAEWDSFAPATDIGDVLAELGIPNDPKFHQQPYDFVRVFPLALRSYQSEMGERVSILADIVLNRVLFALFIDALRRSIALHRGSGLDQTAITVEVLDDLGLIASKLCHYFGSTNPVAQMIQVETCREWADWFRHTAGCFDPVSGVLIDPETAANREFDMQTRHVRTRQAPQKRKSKPDAE